jgi:hypothetical protein
MKQHSGFREAATEAINQPLDKCTEQSKALDVLIVPVDKCVIQPNGENAVTILSQDGETVSFSVLQNWKGCQNGKKLDWIATDFVGAHGELTCSTETALDCGLVQTYTAQCEDGMTVIDLFAHDNIFGQTDGSRIFIPPACNPLGDAAKMCHFRYLLQCKPSLCQGLETQSTGRQLRNSDKALH